MTWLHSIFCYMISQNHKDITDIRINQQKFLT